MSIFVFVATTKVTAFALASNLGGGSQFWWRKMEPLLRFPLNEISLDISFAGGRDSRTRGLCRDD